MVVNINDTKEKNHTHTNGLICLGFKNFNMVKITISFLNFIIVFYFFNTFVSFLSLSLSLTLTSTI